MYTFKKDTALIGISELRTRTKDVLAAMPKYMVILQKRNKPFAVLISIEKYNQMQGMINANGGAKRKKKARLQ